ncbi:MAG: hypothetical protein K5905_18465 [Roseibium sp.]|uniref:hypothetical protein n=1 Tax=Roseibium sp. TaxID=1936156 RepID=UPI002605C84B|nr:hypothetical protein [Roseibium sp.]MCV0427447.1 hypothetical protein [Roseibium sp.]
MKATAGDVNPNDEPCTPQRAGTVPFKALRKDTRFSYCIHVPKSFVSDPTGHRLLVALHGSDRNALELCRLFQNLAETHRYVILCPLFPGGVGQPENMDGYKFLFEGDLSYVSVIDDMIGEVEKRLQIAFDEICLFGISGGAQCAHRYAIVRPDRIAAASIAAPGTISIPGLRDSWWRGTHDLQERFGSEFSLEQFSRIRFQLLVGAADTDETEILPARNSAYQNSVTEFGGRNRVERLQTLHRALKDLNVSSEIELIPDVAHQLEPMFGRVLSFFEDISLGEIEPKRVRNFGI